MDHLFQILTNTADGAFVVNKEQRVVYWNQAAQGLLGYPANKVLGCACYEILRGCNDKGQPLCYRHCPIFTSALAGEPVPDYDLATRTRSGRMLWINTSILIIPADRLPSAPLIIHLFRDATQAKQNEQLIQQMFNAAKEHPPAPASDSHTAPFHLPQLTKREHEVLTLLTQGLSTIEISQALSISPATVRNHVQSILHSLQVHSRVEAVVYALEHHLADESG